MSKIAITTYGGFRLTEEAIARYEELGGIVDEDGCIPRDSKQLIQVLEEMGKYASPAGHSDLEIFEIPDDIEWGILEMECREWIVDKNRIWPPLSIY
jgi:hypothetical protein